MKKSFKCGTLIAYHDCFRTSPSAGTLDDFAVVLGYENDPTFHYENTFVKLLRNMNIEKLSANYVHDVFREVSNAK